MLTLWTWKNARPTLTSNKKHHCSSALKGAVLACTLPNKSKFNNDLKKAVYAKVDPDTLGTMENGVEKVITILDDIFEKKQLWYM